ncbi:hypothetical protein QBC35DRAFT_247478 [Podospora australis]|uniref:Uncharacterized protein n=1 Tax=Podospora australis TaxID=1536484 RepID=A0AAN6X2C6_9PEZI|nr:hypothetical protein QBC35DRAFT_247478 [Podospora australis]
MISMSGGEPSSSSFAALYGSDDDDLHGRFPRQRSHSPADPHKPLTTTAAITTTPIPKRGGIQPLLLLVALVNLSWSLYSLPVSRVVEGRLCRDYFAVHDPSVLLLHPGDVPEEMCKAVDEVQQGLGKLQGVMETLWVGGDFFLTIPLVSLADRYGYRFVLCLNLIPRAFLLFWTFCVGYFDTVLPVNAVALAPVFSFLGGDCVFNSIIYALVSELTDDHVLRATFFGYVNAVSGVFSLQLGPALASATMSALIWLPLWLGILLLLLAAVVISNLPANPIPRRQTPPISSHEDETTAPLIPSSSSFYPQRKPTLKAVITHRFNILLNLLTNPSRNFILLLLTFFLASLASSDTKLLTLYISKRYSRKFSSVGYLLSAKAVFNFFLLTVLIPRFLRWRRRSPSSPLLPSSSIGPSPATADKETTRNALACLILSVLGALAIAFSTTISVLVPSLLLYAMGIALPMFTYSLLKSPFILLPQNNNSNDATSSGPGTHLFSLVMLIRTVGTLLGAIMMPTIWVAALKTGSSQALGMPWVVSALFYAVAALVVKQIRIPP